jgi:hypothetical protein
MFKTVSLPTETWEKIVRRLTAEVGADDASRRWAGAIAEQTSGAVKVRATSRSVQFKAGKGADLRGMLGLK